MAYVADGGRRNGGCECIEIVVSWLQTVQAG